MTSTNTIKTTLSNTIRLIVLFVLLLSSSNSVFAQSVDTINTDVVISSDNTTRATSINVSENNSMNLYSWFMGTKQTPNSNLQKEDSGSIKIQMINSGIEPNRLLLKSFLKKAVNYTEVVA